MKGQLSASRGTKGSNRPDSQKQKYRSSTASYLPAIPTAKAREPDANLPGSKEKVSKEIRGRPISRESRSSDKMPEKSKRESKSKREPKAKRKEDKDDVITAEHIPTEKIQFKTSSTELASILSQARGCLSTSLLEKCEKPTSASEEDVEKVKIARQAKEALAARKGVPLDSTKLKDANGVKAAKDKKEELRDSKEKDKKESRHKIDAGEFMEMIKTRAAASFQCSLEIRVEAVGVTAKCSVSMKKGQKEGSIGKVKTDKPKIISCKGEKIEGVLKIEGCTEAIAFGVDCGTKPFGCDSKLVRPLYVGNLQKMRATITGTVAQGEASAVATIAAAVTGSTTEGGCKTEPEECEKEVDGRTDDDLSPAITVLSADLTIEGDPKNAILKVRIRAATDIEVRRARATESLKEAEESGNYQELHGVIIRATGEGVDKASLDHASTVLKGLKPEVLDKAEIREKMLWSNVTTCNLEPEMENCEKDTECSMCAATNPGEKLEFLKGAVDMALSGLKVDGKKSVVNPQQWLFEKLVECAIDLPDECVWKAGGKFILSSGDRNQSPQALLPLLEKHGKLDAVEAIKSLIAWTEEYVKCSVAAVQINFHHCSDTFHAQHRDIFGIKQKEKAGRDCTCSFKNCVGTMCFSLGSSRQLMLQKMSDNLSSYEPCGEGCTGCREKRYFQSGESMYFNAVWNNNFTHGIPAALHHVGPRISIALLCAPPPVDVCPMKVNYF